MSQERPPIGSIWTHVKTGGVYTVLGVAECATNGYSNGGDAVVYVSRRTGEMYYRTLAEFMDGRFVPLVTRDA